MPVFDDVSEMLGQSKGLGQPDHAECREDRTRAVRGVAMLDLDPRAQAMIEHLLQTQLAERFVLSEPDRADIRIIDLDTNRGAELWAKERKTKPGPHLILLSIAEPQGGGSASIIRKPLTSRALIDALTTAAAGRAALDSRHGRAAPAIAPKPSLPTSAGEAAAARTTPLPSGRKLQAVSSDGHPRKPRRATVSAGSLGPKLAEGDMKALIGSAPDIDPNDRAQIARAQFDPDAYLIGGLIRTLLLARRSGPAARLEIGQGAITVLPRTGLAMIEPQHFQLRRLAETPLMEPTTQVRLVEEPDLSRVPRRALMPLESLLWNTALLASRGRAPCGLDLDAPLRLKHWPNLARLSAFPHAARITALLSGAPISLIEAARVLRVPQRFVFALAAAADALELIERPETGADRAQPRKNGQVDTKVQGQRGLLSRLWAQLRK